MNIIELQFRWRPQGPLLSGYSNEFATEAGLIQPHDKKVVQYRSRNQEQELTPSLLAASVKGVFRSTAAWLVEREGQIAQGRSARRRYITADYADALPTQGKLQGAVDTVGRVDQLCPIGRVFGGGGGVKGESRNALRQQGLVRFGFEQNGSSNDALFGTVEPVRNQYFAWEKAGEENGKEPKAMQTERLVVADEPRLAVRIQASGAGQSEADQRLAAALVCLAADLISTGFFRFGRFTSRGYGWVLLAEPCGRKADLRTLFGPDAVKSIEWIKADSGAALAKQLLGQEPQAIVRDVVRAWIQG